LHSSPRAASPSDGPTRAAPQPAGVRLSLANLASAPAQHLAHSAPSQRQLIVLDAARTFVDSLAEVWKTVLNVSLPTGAAGSRGLPVGGRTSAGALAGTTGTGSGSAGRAQALGGASVTASTIAALPATDATQCQCTAGGSSANFKPARASVVASHARTAHT
jgi:hypothetical protein